MKFYITIALMTYPIILNAQGKLLFNDSNKIYNSNIIAIGDMHGMSGYTTFMTELVENLIDNNHLTDIVLEVSRSCAYLYNKYIQTGDVRLLDSNMLFTRGVKITKFWAKLHDYHLKNININISGVDFERMELTKAIRLILSEQQKIDNELYKYIASLPDTIMKLNIYYNMRGERQKVYDDIIRIYNKNRKYYDSIRDSGCSISDFINNPVSENKFGKRLKNMQSNFSQLFQNDNHIYLVALGTVHVEEPHPIFYSVRKKYLNKENITKIFFISKNCTLGGFKLKAKKYALSGNNHIIKNKTLVDEVFSMNEKCSYRFIKVDSTFLKKYSISNPDLIDYIIPINCDYIDNYCSD